MPPVRWPAGVMPFVLLVGLTLLGVATVQLAVAGATPPRHWLTQVHLLVLRSAANVRLVFVSACVAHALETLFALVYLSRKCGDVARRPARVIGWLALVLLVGYPSLLRLMADVRGAARSWERRGNVHEHTGSGIDRRAR